MSFDQSKPSFILEFNRVATRNAVPTIKDVKRQFKLADDEIDVGFGVIPQGESFLAVISAEAAKRIEKEHRPGFVKNWCNPAIGPFDLS